MLESYLKQINNYETYFLIGSNGVGKTYNLLKIYNEDTTKNVYISEEGELLHTANKSKIKLDLGEKSYIFNVDEKQRGNANNISNISKLVPIENRLFKLLSFCSQELINISKIQRKSKGQYKLMNILEIITSTFLNTVSIILFDEPENYLDDNYLRVIAITIFSFKRSKD